MLVKIAICRPLQAISIDSQVHLTDYMILNHYLLALMLKTLKNINKFPACIDK